ncbi:MAG: hypothetical protein ABEJ72_06675, partial [Candidatus Aenigmatarchaeota archaeon]
MEPILIWLLPIVDVFRQEKILSYYSKLGVDIPKKHSKYGLIERWIGYLPVGIILGLIISLVKSVLILIAILALVGPIEFYLMHLGFGPWDFFKEKDRETVGKIFMLETYNALS